MANFDKCICRLKVNRCSNELLIIMENESLIYKTGTATAAAHLFQNKKVTFVSTS